MKYIFQKLGIIYAVLQTFNAKFQYAKKLPRFIAIKVICFPIMYISLIAGSVQSS